MPAEPPDYRDGKNLPDRTTDQNFVNPIRGDEVLSGRPLACLFRIAVQHDVFLRFGGSVKTEFLCNLDESAALFIEWYKCTKFCQECTKTQHLKQ